MKVKDVEPKIIWMLAKAYVNCPYSTFELIGNYYGLSSKTVSGVLWRGIAENILPTNIADAIYFKFTHCNNPLIEQHISRWDEAFELREKKRAKISKLLVLYQRKIVLLEHYINNYEYYVAMSQKNIPLNELVDELEHNKKRVLCCINALK